MTVHALVGEGPLLYELFGQADGGREHSAVRNEIVHWISSVARSVDPTSEARHTLEAFRSRAIARKEAEDVASTNDPQVQRARRELTDARHQIDDLRRTYDQGQIAIAEALRDTISARDEAQKAAGERGVTSLTGAFEEYRKRHLRAAFGFRLATIVVLALALAVAVVFVFGWDTIIIPTRFSDTRDPNDWHQVVYRLAIIAALAGLSAYLGRQSGQHRRLGEWARSIETQLQSFLAFVEPVLDPQTKNAIYLTFAARVLGAPPDGVEKADLSPSIQPLMDLVLRTRS